MSTLRFGKEKDKSHAFVTGVFFLAAAITSMAALKLYEPILYHPQYLIQGTTHMHQVVFGAILELITVGTVAGTGILLYPYLRKFNEILGLGYLCFRLLEAILILMGVVSVLSLLTLSQTYTSTVAPDVAMYQTGGSILKAVHDWTFLLGPNFMLGINTFLYSLIFYQSKLIPAKIAMLGLAGAIFIFIAALLEMFGVIWQLSIWGVLFALPVFAYEMILAYWLIRKGYNPVIFSDKGLNTN